MTHKEFIETKIINVLNDIEESAIIKADDFTEERMNNMIIVGIAREEQMNFALPDYKYDLEIIIDTFIDDDTDGKLFNTTWKEVDRRLSRWYLNEAPLDSLFGSNEIVYFQKDSIDFMLDQSSKSNRAILRFTIIGSFE